LKKGRPVPRQNEIAAQAIIIMGVSGCGKSTLAAALAEELACPFFEGDSFHSAENIARMRGGVPLDDMDRWPWLDRLGAAVACGIHASGLTVAACSALKRTYRDRLRQAIGAPVSFVLLEANREELTRRLASRSDHYMPASLLDSQLATLQIPASDERALTLDSTKPPAVLTMQVAEWLAQSEPKRVMRRD